uniref:outer membrane beta-barrel protein n=1 Tax=Thaumasiovibrio occultus TaxID=1891184 RepID=UPI000B354E66|nr:outer membrane beta-barrel protein [Thaumasiovibrio occultus]
MKNILVASVILFPLSTAWASPYFGGNLALGSNYRSLFGESASFVAGYNHKLSHEFSLGVEAEYRDFGREMYWGYFNQYRGSSVRAKSYGLTLKPTYHIDAHSVSFYLSPLLGMHQFEETWRTPTDQGSQITHNYDDLSFQWGLEFGMHLNERLSFNSGFKIARPSLMGGRVEYEQVYMGLNFHL